MRFNLLGYLLLFSANLTAASPITGTTTTPDLATTLAVRQDDMTSPIRRDHTSPTPRKKRQNNTNSAIFEVKACCSKALDQVGGTLLLAQFGMDVNGLVNRFISGSHRPCFLDLALSSFISLQWCEQQGGSWRRRRIRSAPDAGDRDRNQSKSERCHRDCYPESSITELGLVEPYLVLSIEYAGGWWWES
ncbi:hypothetical protein B0H66DRAFT_605206 [Apodospora peruviana]|uniref:Hydrophobin n=1 Tax=Apodospora peruviana TaxID=516989 RepID=A0AAE0M322_9PEZI|nr:hypothetical protein B0H66DRAFT_605206 [Apodospora peruviana]